MIEKYSAALYVRLSKEDGDKVESDSIASQRALLRDFVSDKEDIAVYSEYIDAGYSGVNFERPQFRQMMEDMKAGWVNCVIVKDLSRFGRDYIEAGRLIQKIFPSACVRFIAVTDHFDSLTASYGETALMLPVKNFINDSYSRDISVKVRSQQKIKRENGEFIGAFCMYGYKKSERKKNMLVPDEYAAYIVQWIFHWKLEGYSNSAIAERLNRYGVLSPMEYKRLLGERYLTGFATGMWAQWSAVAVKRILANE